MSPAMSATSMSPRKTWRKTRSYVSCWSCAVVRVTRPSQYNSCSDTGSASTTLVVNRALRSGVTGTPARCSRSPNAAQMAGRSALSATSHPGQALGARQILVFAVLQHRTERALYSTLVQLGDSKQGCSVHPIDGFSDPGWLLHVESAQSLHRTGHLLRELGGCLRHSGTHDGSGLVKFWVVDPVIEATT